MPRTSLLLLTDGRFPAGTYAHSGGLEAAVEDGLEVAALPAYLDGRLRNVAFAEACLAVAAARAARRGDLDALIGLDLEAQARCAGPALRAAARRLGAQLLRSAAVVWPAARVIDDYRRASDITPRPVAFGVVAAAADLDDRALAHASLYEDATTVLAAAVRLLPVDAATTAGWLIEMSPLLEELAARAAAVPSDVRRLPGSFAPAIELRSLAHAEREAKLFAS
jgi:urease accessory protein